jgi:hypothetical protein
MDAVESENHTDWIAINPAEDEMATIETASSFTRVHDPSSPDGAEVDENLSAEEEKSNGMDPQSEREERIDLKEADSGDNDESRVDLEIVENHMRHAGSNAGPFYARDMPVVLGRDVFKRHDKHRVRGLISRDHCRIEASVGEEGEVKYYVKDTSINGTFLGPHRILPNGPGALLEHGDVIGLLTSHSSPIETYSAEGEIFKVTLGLRWLRPNQNCSKNDLIPIKTDSHGHIRSQIAEENMSGVFYGIEFIADDQSSQISEAQGSHRSARSTASGTSVKSLSTPKAPNRSIRISKNPKTHSGGKNKRAERKPLDPSLKNHSGNDTDDTDGDDELDLGSTHKTPAAKSGRTKPIAVSKPTIEESTYDSPHPSTKTPSTSSSSKRSRGKSPKPHTPKGYSPSPSLASSSSSISRTIAPGSYWSVTPGSRDRKRSRSTSEAASADDLSEEEPARKIPRV